MWVGLKKGQNLEWGVRRLAVVVVGGKGRGRGRETARGTETENRDKERGEIRAHRNSLQFQTPCVAKMVKPAR